jgi:Xaa-Pro aminopeptidase
MDRYQPFPIDPSWQQNFQPMEFVQNNPELISGDHWQKPDRERMAIYRYQRLQQEIIRYDCAGALLFSPMNVRYATETIYAPITNMHSPTRSVFVPDQGSATLYDSAVDALDWLPDFIGECRQSPVTAYFIAGDSYADSSRRFAREIAHLIRFQGGSRRLAIDMAEPELILALNSEGMEIVNAEKIVERAAAIKSEDELRCITTSVSIAQAGLSQIRQHLQAGITEQALWAYLAYQNAINGDGWFEYSILVSGQRTNPWGRECSEKAIRAGELVGVDTGMIGPGGYGADISRTFYCQPGQPSTEQKRLYQIAIENLSFNLELIRAGMSFREFAKKSWPVPPEFWVRRYNSVAHGVGMGNEWPHIPFATDWEKTDEREGVFEENMVMAIESCIGREDGVECVKLEDMVVVKKGKCQLLSTFPFEDDLML